MNIYTAKEMAEILQNEGENITLRTIRYYAQEGTLPERDLIDGKLVYSDKHLDHLRSIVAMKKTGKKLNNIRSSLQSFSEDAIKNFSQNHYHFIHDYTENMLERDVHKINDDIHITFSNSIKQAERNEIITSVLGIYKNNRSDE